MKRKLKIVARSKTIQKLRNIFQIAVIYLLFFIDYLIPCKNFDIYK